MTRALAALIALVLAALSVWQLEGDRAGLEVSALEVPGGPPATLYLRKGGGPAPVVVVAHGFAGSRPLMEVFSLTLAQAGYTVVAFDFMGHGRNPAPMRGDVTQIDGTTRLMVAEVQAVARAALAHPRADGRLALLGHSMASDIVIRAGLEMPKADAIVAVSMFSQAVTATAPGNLLIIVGAWETRLVDEGLRVLHLADPSAQPGQVVGDPGEGTGRRLVLAPSVEHVGVLYSGTSLRAARDWLDAGFGRVSDAPVALRGGWIVLLLGAVVALGWPLARALPAGPAPAPLPRGVFLAAALVPVLLVPLVLWPVRIQVLPVLVADYLALHFAAFGVIVLGLLWRAGQLQGVLAPRVWPMALAVAAFAVLIVGGVIDRYVTSFFPHPGRALVIAGLIPGAVLFWLGDAVLTEGGRAGFGRVLLVRGGFVVSLLLAVALNFDRLMFLLIILPVIVLFFLLFGTFAGWVGRRTGLPSVAGLGFGVMLAWSLGVTFPMFAP